MGYNREYYQAHREEILAKQHRYYWRDPERYRNYCKEYKKKNREKRKEYEQKYDLTPNGIWTRLRKPEREISKKTLLNGIIYRIKNVYIVKFPKKKSKERILDVGDRKDYKLIEEITLNHTKKGI